MPDERALRMGDFRPCTAHRLLAFEQHTDRAADTIVVVVANSHPEEVTETVRAAHSKLMDSSPMIDLLDTFSRSGRPGCKDSAASRSSPGGCTSPCRRGVPWSCNPTPRPAAPGLDQSRAGS